MRHVTLVTGPPCAGKSRWVDEHAGPTDVVVCFDRLARAAGSPNQHRHTAAQRAAAGDRFRALCATLSERHCVAWVIRCAPTADERQALVDEVLADAVVVLAPPLQLALRRAVGDRRPPSTLSAIRRWYAMYSPRDGEQVHRTSAPTW